MPNTHISNFIISISLCNSIGGMSRVLSCIRVRLVIKAGLISGGGGGWVRVGVKSEVWWVTEC